MMYFIPPTLRGALSIAFICLAVTGLLAQSDRTPAEAALRFLKENPARFNLSASDVADLRVADAYKTEGLNLTHVWVQQQYRGIPVFNALFGLHVSPTGDVLHTGHRFAEHLAERVNTALPALSASTALLMAMKHLGFDGFDLPRLREKINDHNWVFEGGDIARSAIPVSICYMPGADGVLRLAWSMTIAQANSADYWNMRVDALTGQVIDQFNHTNYCKAGHAHPMQGACTSPAVPAPAPTAAPNVPPAGDGASYRVFAWPTESPAHGSHVLVTNPADETASPYGWHDTNGATGPEYQYTRGNNVFAYEDQDGNSQPPATPRPLGGPTLQFDFPYNPAVEPVANADAAITNLFYVCNMMHDITYRYGFTETARNFQVNNYGKGGQGNDPVLAEALDGSGENNANFSTPPDGSSGTMQMYRWARLGGKIINVNAPSGVMGKYFGAAAAGWGKPVGTTPVTADVQVVNDGSSNPSWACFPLIESVAGKIALVDRRSCEFGEKALNAQKAGAVACIICNYQEGTINMGPGAFGGQVNIPVVMMQKSDCDLLRQYAGAGGLNISIALDAAVTGPNYLDGDFDNGIIAHEYGHGISNRLTGLNASCLGNAEQMGEGWSDFFTLVTTVRPGDKGTDRQGVGTFVISQPNDGVGIRRFPYSTDMSINPLTYSTVAENTEVHALGEVWTAMLWDLYWAMADKYGFDADITNTNSGNGRALQLVMDGMKLQPCNPGFQDGRDAIIAADKARYAGADTCLIMGVFARRGLGYSSKQGSANNASDGVENFDPIPYCIKNLKITKSTSNPTITAGDEVNFSIKVSNHKAETANNVRVTDELPAGLTFISASDGGKLENGYVVWEIGSMPTLTAKTLTYKAKSASNIGCDIYFNDDMEVTDDWYAPSLKGNQVFDLQSAVVKTGSAAWFGAGSNAESDFVLEHQLTITVQGSRPHLRFWHQYNTEIGVDAGFLEIQQEGIAGWAALPAQRVVRHPYSAKIPYSTFALPFLSGFSGNSNGWVQSYCDLSQYAGKKIQVRFRMGTNADAQSGAAQLAKWYVDDMEQVNLFSFEGQACVTYEGGNPACAKAPESGVIVNRGTSATHDALTQTLLMQVQPNPANDLLNVTLHEPVDGKMHLQLLNAEGRQVISLQRQQYTAGQVLTLDTSRLPAGVYVLRIQTATALGMERVVVKH